MHKKPQLSDPISPIIEFAEFLNVDVRVGEIKQAEIFKDARNPSYILQIDFGETVGTKKSSAQITENYRPEELVGKKVAAVVNFKPRQIGPIMSEVLTLGFPDENGHVVLFSPDHYVPNGSRLF